MRKTGVRHLWPLRFEDFLFSFWWSVDGGWDEVGPGRRREGRVGEGNVLIEDRSSFGRAVSRASSRFAHTVGQTLAK